MRPHLTGHFSKLLQQKIDEPKQKRKRINSHVYREASTNDEIIEQLEKEMQEQQCKKKTKTKSKEPVI